MQKMNIKTKLDAQVIPCRFLCIYARHHKDEPIKKHGYKERSIFRLGLNIIRKDFVNTKIRITDMFLTMLESCGYSFVADRQLKNVP